MLEAEELRPLEHRMGYTEKMRIKALKSDANLNRASGSDAKQSLDQIINEKLHRYNQPDVQEARLYAHQESAQPPIGMINLSH